MATKRTKVTTRITDDERLLLSRLSEDYGIAGSDVMRGMLTLLAGYITTTQGRTKEYDWLLKKAVTTGHPLYWQQLADLHSAIFWDNLAQGIHPYSNETLESEAAYLEAVERAERDGTEPPPKRNLCPCTKTPPVYPAN